MGRRKIEIQPITRKNGLFKKAYELGVLCSVDVAVIIFEERPGHQVKLYQYCSGDANGIVQRHLQFDGERDTKAPHDFCGTKGEDAGEDDDEVEDDDSKPKKEKSSSKGSTSKPKDSSIPPAGNAVVVPILPAQSQSPMQTEDSPRPSSLPTPPEHPTSTLPVSNDRLTSDRSSRADSIPTLGGGINLPLPIPLNMPPNKRARLEEPSVVPPPGLTFPYRLDVDLSTFPPAAHATSLPHVPSHTSHSSSGLNLPFSHNAMGLMGMQNPNLLSQAVPPFDLSGRSIPYPQLSRGYGATLEGLFGSRPTSGSQSQATSMLLDLLNSTGGGFNLNSQPPPSFPAFEWPVTMSPSQPQNPSEAHGPAGSNSSNSINASGGGNSSNESASWLEFLTSATASPPVNLGGLPTPTNHTPPSSVSSVSSFDTMRGTSPTRKRHREDMSDRERSLSIS
ncbi:hypothetical protein BDY19DRAFT_996449 [Irpex rosettiformis]|uniref:Uncharacterized protein n=1 Tax=Irpex rosettiformis TaxID=378272 RepID=A0ACB8TUY0_9APHY|nr:hypothetical protein BDY19DRAFT_996449 [Irpex rosettiformis]